MKGKPPKRIIGAKLKPLIATWAPVKEALNATTFQAIAFVEQMCERLGVVLYDEDEMTGLWMPCGDQNREMIQKLGCSDYAHSVANDDVPMEPGKWESRLRVTPADFRAILDAANEIASDGEGAESADRRATEIEYEMLKAKQEELWAESLRRIQELAWKVLRG